MSLTGWTPRARPINPATGEIPDGTTNHRTPFKYSPRPIKLNIAGVLTAVRQGNRGRGFTGKPEHKRAFNPVFSTDDLYRFNRRRFSEAKAACKSCGNTHHLSGTGVCAGCDQMLRETFPGLLEMREQP